MIGFYSSYLEFIGAIYFSMSLDEILKKRIWSPQDEKKQRRVLEALGEYKDKNFVKAVVDANQAKGAILQAELNKKSVIGLFIIAFLLLLCGFESYWGNTHDNVDLFNFHLCVAYTMSTFLVSLFFLQWIVFNKWKYSVVYICSLLFFFALIFGFNLTYGECRVEKIEFNAPAKLLKEVMDKKTGIPGLKAAYAEESFYIGANQLDALVNINKPQKISKNFKKSLDK